MIQQVVPGFRTDIEPLVNPRLISRTRSIANANPHHVWPFSNIYTDGSLADQYMVFCTDITPEFIQREILPCGRPHIGLVHIALINDAIATSSFEIITDERYGTAYRYVELGAVAGNHQEAFVKGSIIEPPHGTIEVSGYRIRWQLMPRKPNKPMVQRGILQVGIFGLIAEGETQVASVEVEYFRRKGVLNNVNKQEGGK